MSLTKEDLLLELASKGIKLDDSIKWDNLTMTKRLGDHWMLQNQDKITFGMSYVQSLDNPMLIDHYKDYTKFFTEENEPINSDEWITELKNDGFRCIVVYDPLTGFELFSRRESVKTFVNGVFTDKVLFIKRGLIRTPDSFKGVFNYRFVIDCEAMVNSDSMSFEGVEYTTIEDFLQAVLGSSPEKAKNYQMNGCTLYFKVFDILYFEKDPQPLEQLPTYVYKGEVVPEEDAEWVLKNFSKYLTTSGFDLSLKTKKNGEIDTKAKKPWEKAPLKKIFIYLASLKDTSSHDIRKFPFAKRRVLRNNIVKFLQQNNLPFEYIETEDTNKLAFTEEMIESGNEGSILKNLNAPYISSLKSSRSHRACFKIKSSIAQLMENMEDYADFDCFISGAQPPKSKRIKDMIGSLTCSIYLINDKGETVEHEIANIAGIPHELKRAMTTIDINGNIGLNSDYIGKVIAIDGYALSHKSLRFSHARLKDNTLQYKNKAPIECVRDIETLRSMISVRSK